MPTHQLQIDLLPLKKILAISRLAFGLLIISLGKSKISQIGMQGSYPIMRKTRAQETISERDFNDISI